MFAAIVSRHLRFRGGWNPSVVVLFLPVAASADFELSLIKYRAPKARNIISLTSGNLTSGCVPDLVLY